MARSLAISEKRLLGWEPTETHVHEYDESGRLVRTVVTRDPEWDDLEREKMQALAQYESGVCECGLHESVAAEDPDLELVPRYCPTCAGIATAMRVVHANDDVAIKELGENPAPDAPRPDDGRHFGLSGKVSTSLPDS